MRVSLPSFQCTLYVVSIARMSMAKNTAFLDVAQSPSINCFVLSEANAESPAWKDHIMAHECVLDLLTYLDTCMYGSEYGTFILSCALVPEEAVMKTGMLPAAC